MNWIDHEVLRAKAMTGEIIDFEKFPMKSGLPGNAIAGAGLFASFVAFITYRLSPGWFDQHGSYVWPAVILLIAAGLLMEWQNLRSRRDAYAAYLRPFSEEQLNAIWDERFRYPSILSVETTSAARRELDRRV
jgi:hypothetical protein